MDDTISRQAAIDALWKALYEYEEKTEKQFQESEDLNVEDWMMHRIFAQNMNDIDRQTILNLPSVQPKKGKWIRTTKHYKDSEQEYSYYEISCSECGAIRKIGWHDARYCPNCGADMETEHD